MQNVEFRVDRYMCEEKNSYSEVGDVILYQESYFEIDNTLETQLIGGLPDDGRNWSIVCSTFMVSKSTLNIEERVN